MKISKSAINISFIFLFFSTVVTPVFADLKINPESAILAKEVQLADLHYHPRSRIQPEQFLKVMNDNGVKWAGAGATSSAALSAAKGKTGKSIEGGERSLWLSYKEELGSKFIAFAGQSEMIHIYAEGGVKAQEDPENPKFKAFLQEAEQDLKSGRVKGIGEVFINNKRSSKIKKFRRKSRANAPTVLQMFNLVAKYNSVLTIHMDSDSDSLAQMTELLKSNPDGQLLWNHCGIFIKAADLKPIMASNPNLYCEFAYRYPPMNGSKRAYANVFDKSGPKKEWIDLIEEFPDRFLVGTDAKSAKSYSKSIRNVRQGLLPYLKPTTLTKMAYQNAQRLFGLN